MQDSLVCTPWWSSAPGSLQGSVCTWSPTSPVQSISRCRSWELCVNSCASSDLPSWVSEHGPEGCKRKEAMALSPQFIWGVAKRRQHQPPKASEPGGKGKRLLSFKESLALRKNYGAANIGNITKPYRLNKKKIKKSLFFILYVLSF